MPTKTYHKLVRDRIPRSSNRTVKYASAKHFLTRTTYLLDQKLDEELAEYQESKSLEELADLLEVIQAVEGPWLDCRRTGTSTGRESHQTGWI